MKPSEIVSRLLESEDEPLPDESDLERYADAISTDDDDGTINYHNAQTCSTFYHRTIRYKSRKKNQPGAPYEARRNGATKTWKTRPGQFRIPVKIGFKEYGYIDNDNAHEWSTRPDFLTPEAKAKRERLKTMNRLMREPVDPLPFEREPAPPRDPNQSELFNEHVSRLRKLGLY